MPRDVLSKPCVTGPRRTPWNSERGRRGAPRILCKRPLRTSSRPVKQGHQRSRIRRRSQDCCPASEWHNREGRSVHPRMVAKRALCHETEACLQGSSSDWWVSRPVTPAAKRPSPWGSLLVRHGAEINEGGKRTSTGPTLFASQSGILICISMTVSQGHQVGRQLLLVCYGGLLKKTTGSDTRRVRGHARACPELP